ncbi:MAG TPA: DUF748 domain-containing protein [Opitutus sp.]|nr:DUF748 domain-containing protein [Opitutus sp.]
MALVLVGARLALPSVLEHLVNRRLAHIPGYAGRVGDIDVALWRGAYVLHDLDIRRTRGKVREPFFRAREIDFSLAWRELFHGKVVSDIHATGAQLTVVTGRDVTRSQTDLDRRWQNVAESLFPIDITHLEISDGLIRYIDRTRDPAVDLFVTRVRLKATGLRNRRGEDGGGEFPADISLEGTSLGAGHLTARLRAEPLAPQPHFHLGLKLTDVNLPAINPSLKAYANVDVSHGIFRLVVEMAGRDGAFRGYAKPFFEDLDFKNLADEHEGPGHAIWESVVAFVTDLVKNHPRDQLATRIPFRGRFGDAQVGFLATIRNVFRHGFVRAFNPTIEHSVHADKVNPDGTRRAGKN